MMEALLQNVPLTMAGLQRGHPPRGVIHQLDQVGSTCQPWVPPKHLLDKYGASAQNAEVP